MIIPSCYASGYEKARKVDPALAEQYLRYTTIGDPVADAVVAELAAIAGPKSTHQLIGTALRNYDNLPADTPRSLRNLVADATVVPDWLDQEMVRMATRGFLRNSELILGALVGGAIIEGFSTLISKSFRIRGRIMSNGVRRLKQNLLQLLEQYLPGGIEPGGDGWKLSLRIRLVHAQARRLVATADEWDHAAYGLPLSASHMLLGSAAFSGRLMQHVSRIGGDMSKKEREAYVHVWRYTGLLLGVPEEILFDDFASSVRAFELGKLCEPPPDHDGIIMANSIINSAPIVLGHTETSERRHMASYMYQISRELIGNELADELRYPHAKRWKRPRLLLRMRYVGEKILRRVAPSLAADRSRSRFGAMLAVSDMGTQEHSYGLPSSVFDEDSQEW